MYVTEVIGLTYFNRMPPEYDGTMYRTALKLLKLPPILMMLFGYWAIGNTEIFGGYQPN
jgi:hypothetical protein